MCAPWGFASLRGTLFTFSLALFVNVCIIQAVNAKQTKQPCTCGLCMPSLEEADALERLEREERRVRVERPKLVPVVLMPREVELALN